MQPIAETDGPGFAIEAVGRAKGRSTGRESGAPSSKSRQQTRKWTLGRGVLILGQIRELALYRAEVLRAHGFSVATPRTEEEMKTAIRRGNFDVAVLSYTLPSDTVEEMAELMREYCRDCALVAITDTGRIDRKIGPDAVVLADDGPGALIEALRHLTRSN